MTTKTTAVARTPTSLKTQLTAAREAITALIPKHMDADKVIRLAWLVCYREPKLKAADPVEVVQAVLRASSLGLMIGYDAHLLPFFNKKANRYDVTLVPDYRGLLGLARRAGVLDVDAKAVFMGEGFDVLYGTEPKLTHIPKWDANRDYAHLVAVYAMAVLPNPGGPPIRRWEVMTRTEVEAVRVRSRAKDDGPWVTDPVQMALKTVLRRIAKTLPQSPELAAALELDTRAETGHAELVLPDDKEEQLSNDAADKAAEKQAALRQRLGPPPEGVDEDGVVIEQEPAPGAPVAPAVKEAPKPAPAPAKKPQPVEEEPQANWPEEA